MDKYNDTIGGVAVSKGYSIRIRIAGRTFGIISDEKPEYLKRIAQDVDESISKMLANNPNLTFERAAVLAALKYCDDAKKAQTKGYIENTNNDHDNLRQQVMQYANELSEMSEKCKSLEKELIEQKKEDENMISEIKMHYQAREAQFREYIKNIKQKNS